jgi:hypothetical protein
MITIRRFAEGDHDDVVALIQGVMSKEFAQDAYAYPTADLDAINDTYGGLGEAFFVAIDGKKVVGTVGIKKKMIASLFTPYVCIAGLSRAKNRK